jgi:protein ImuA
MGPAKALPTLNRLRQMLAGVDPSLAPRWPGGAATFDLSNIDAALGGGLARTELHELAPASPIDLAAATGFAVALAARAQRLRGQVLWIAMDFALTEAGDPYGLGLDLFGLSTTSLLMLRVPRATDVLWAAEESLRCRALAGVVAELAGDVEVELTASRRLALAAREGAALALLLRHRSSSEPSAAATRWRIASGPSKPDNYGGLGRTRFELSLVKNRRGPVGRWSIEWNHHDCVFAAVSLSVAAAAFDRPDRAARAAVR